jgi:hypothetical protein
MTPLNIGDDTNGSQGWLRPCFRVRLELLLPFLLRPCDVGRDPSSLQPLTDQLYLRMVTHPLFLASMDRHLPQASKTTVLLHGIDICGKHIETLEFAD